MSEPDEHTIYKYTDKNGRVTYTDVPPNLADVKVVGFTGNTAGRAQTRPLPGGSTSSGASGGQSEAIKKLNAEWQAQTADFQAKHAVYNEKLIAYGTAANKLNAERGFLFGVLKDSNAALKKLDESQDASGYRIAALSIIGTGILLVATAPVTFVVGGVLVIGTAVAGEVNDRLRPVNTEHNDYPEADTSKKASKSLLRTGEAAEAAHHIHKAAEVFAEGGKSMARVGSRGLPIVGAIVTGGMAYKSAVSTQANQIGGEGLNSIAGLESLDAKLKEFNPSFLERRVFNKERLRRSIAETKDAQKQYEAAVREIDEASAAAGEAYRALNDTYVALKGR